MASIASPAYSSSHNLDAGTYGQVAGTANLTGTDAGDYTLTALSNPASYTVSPLALNGAIAGVTTTYGTAAPTGAVSFSNAVAGDNVVATNVATIVNPVNSGSGHLDAGSYDQAVAGGVTGTDAGNYTFGGATTPTANYMVSQAQLMYVASPISVISGHPIPALSGTISGVVSGDSPYTGVPAWATVDGNVFTIHKRHRLPVAIP